MTRTRLTVLTLSAFVALTAAGQVRAQSASPGLTLVGNDFSTPNYGSGPVTTGHTLEWDSRKGRWGLKLGVEQRTDALGEWRDVQPGVYYKLTPSLHIGGGVSLPTESQVNPHLMEPPTTAPRVRLETTFKF
jgi:hypothetical protein